MVHYLFISSIQLLLFNHIILLCLNSPWKSMQLKADDYVPLSLVMSLEFQKFALCPVSPTYFSSQQRLLSASQVVLVVKNPLANARGIGEVGLIPWTSKRRPTSVFFLGKLYGKRSLVGYSLWSHKQTNTSQAAYHAHTEAFETFTEIRNLVIVS